MAAVAIGCGVEEAGVDRASTVRSAIDWGGSSESVSPGAAAEPRVPAAGSAWVLHVGDSFVDAAFQQNLAPRFRALGARQTALAKTGTSTVDWASDPELDGWLARRPSLVLITLGANELDIPYPKYRAATVQAIARKAGSVAACVWVAPPLWKEDRAGWLQVIYEHSAPCLFFDSDALLGGLADGERCPDRIHPNARGGARWAATFWGWLEDHRDPERGPWAFVAHERRAPLAWAR